MKKSVFIVISVLFIGLLTLFVFNKSQVTVVNPLFVSNENLKPIDINAISSNVNLNDISKALPDSLKHTSLKGTEIDGIYPVDKDGNLLFSKSIKHRFEYFLSLMGEFDLDHVMELIRSDITSNLNSPAQEQALKLFDDYVAYKYALSELEESLSKPQRYEINDIAYMRNKLQQMRDVRREYLPLEVVDEFFGFDEMYDDFMLTGLEIKNNQQLSLAEKQQQLKDLEQSLPQDVQAMRDETQRISQVFLLSNTIIENGGSDQDVYKLNEQEFGQEAALRLKALNEKRTIWQQRVDDYLNKKKEIMLDENLTDEEKIKQIMILKQSSFEQSEWNKLMAYELMQEQPNG